MSNTARASDLIGELRHVHRYLESLLKQRTSEISEPVAAKITAARAHLHAAITTIQREKEMEGAEE